MCKYIKIYLYRHETRLYKFIRYQINVGDNTTIYFCDKAKGTTHKSNNKQ